MSKTTKFNDKELECSQEEYKKPTWEKSRVAMDIQPSMLDISSIKECDSDPPSGSKVIRTLKVTIPQH